MGIALLVEVLVILIGSCCVGLVLFKSHFKVCYSVRLRTLSIRLLLLLELSRAIRVISRSLIGHLGCFGRLAQFKVSVAICSDHICLVL